MQSITGFKSGKYTRPEIAVLVLLRLAIGWHILYEGVVKIADPKWTSAYFLRDSKWILSGFSEWILANDSVLQVVNVMNSWGLTAIGIGLILGLFTRVASVAGALLLLLYYLNSPPLIGLEYSIPTEGNNLIINKTLIEAICLVALAVFPSGRYLGMDSLFWKDREADKEND